MYVCFFRFKSEVCNKQRTGAGNVKSGRETDDIHESARARTHTHTHTHTLYDIVVSQLQTWGRCEILRLGLHPN
jgi:succinyl-CoA synthetase beta subunit